MPALFYAVNPYQKGESALFNESSVLGLEKTQLVMTPLEERGR